MAKLGSSLFLSGNSLTTFLVVLSTTSGDRSTSVSFGSGVDSHWGVKSTDWVDARRFIYRGSSIVTSPTCTQFLVHISSAAGTGSVRLFDYTHGNVICTKENFNDIVPTIHHVHDLTNIPEDEAVFIIQAKSSSINIWIYISTVVLIY